jgi:hypothetical protein
MAGGREKVAVSNRPSNRHGPGAACFSHLTCITGAARPEEYG